MMQVSQEKPELKKQALTLAGAVAVRGRFQLGPLEASLPFGQITVVVGPNGAGKSTLTRVLLGQIPLKKGHIRLQEREIHTARAEWRARLGFLSDDPNELLIECSAEELWRFCIGVNVLRFPKDIRSQMRAAMLRRARALADMLHFLPPARQPIAEYSLGMRKKTQLIAALCTDPDIIILDEPRNGLDPIGIDQMHRLLRALVAEGKLVLIATHDLAWALAHAHNFLVLRAGRMVLAATADEVKRKGGEAYLLDRLAQD